LLLMVPMSTLSDFAAIHDRFQTVGSALMRVNLNNTHSGNMSCRDPRSAERFWITASGSPCGSLTPADLVAVRFSDLGHEGPARPSSEANTHRRVLELPGVNACVHCHAIASTLIGFETPQKPIFLLASGPNQMEHLFQPVDVWGATLLGAVTVGAYQHTVGSSEMERRIRAYLREAPVTIVKGHGPFARGASLVECLHYLSVLENSAATVIALRRRGVDTLALQRAVRSVGSRAVFGWTPPSLDGPDRPAEPVGDAATRCEFTDWLAYNFDLGLGAFGTGSMSRKLSADEMLFCPMSAAPHGIEAALQRIALRPKRDEAVNPQVRLHRLVYTRTPFNACLLAASPLASAEALTALAAADGIAAPAGQPEAIGRPATQGPVVAPIDAEAAHYKVRLPVAHPWTLAVDAAEGLIPDLLQAGNGCGLIAGCGVIAGGEKNLAQAAYRVALAERVARFRIEVDLNHRVLGGPGPADFE
jgi:ribulose-5-phosphate 4-epimerase/fuculose-1-phosphate aldolase